MCGIYGAISLSGEPLPAVDWDLVAARLHHRGPDGSARWESPHAVLGLTRLAISGPSSPAEVARHGRLVSVCNGELYNDAVLRRSLPPSSRPASAVDTALIPALHAHRGPAWVQHARGMFAAALVDTGRRTLHVWRDPLGKKPLCYAVRRGVLVFASEAKGLLASGLVPARFCPSAIQRVLVRGYLDEDEPFLEGVLVLPPGGWLQASARGVVLERGARWDERLEDHPGRATAEGVGEVLDTAVTRRLRSEVPAAVCLSGGMDSALVAERARLPCVTVGMPPGDETPAATRVARRLRVPHVVVPRLAPSRATLRRALWHLERPDVAAVWDMAAGLMGLARGMAQRGIKVALTGEGADEVFLGYPWQRVEDSPKKDEPWKKFQGSGAPAPPTAPQATGPRRSAWQTRLASDKDKK